MNKEIREAYDRFVQVLNDTLFSREEFIEASEEIISELELGVSAVKDEMDRDGG